MRILDSSTIDLIRTIYTKNSSPPYYINNYGLIWFKWNGLWGHTGGDDGVLTAMFFSEIENTGIIFLTNGDDHPWTNAVDVLFNYAHLFGNIYALKPSVLNPFAKPEIDSVLFQTTFSNINNHLFTAHLIYTNSDSTQIDSLTLLDDGLHNDLLSNDGVYGGYIPPQTNEDFYSLGASTIDGSNKQIFLYSRYF